MTEAQLRLPEAGELIVGRVVRIGRFGAHLALDDYPQVEAFIHVSEISLKWVRNIRNHLREGQREVFKVVRVNPSTLQVDVSLRRVSRRERTSKILEWKRKQKTGKILSTLKERLGVSEHDIDLWIREPLGSDVERIHEALEKISGGEQPSTYFPAAPQNVQQALESLAKSEFRRKAVSLSAELLMTSNDRRGAEAIRTAAREAYSLAKANETVSITVKGAPRYLVRVSSPERETAEALLESVAQKCAEVMGKYSGKAELKRI